MAYFYMVYIEEPWHIYCVNLLYGIALHEMIMMLYTPAYMTLCQNMIPKSRDHISPMIAIALLFLLISCLNNLLEQVLMLYIHRHISAH